MMVPPGADWSRARVKKEWQIVGSGDYNGDGRSDVLLHNALENKFDLWTMMDGGTYESELLPDDFGNAAEVIASGDFDGDEMSDILWRDLESGDVDIWGLTKDSTLGPLEGGGNPWSAIGAGDFDGDGATTCFCERPIRIGSRCASRQRARAK